MTQKICLDCFHKLSPDKPIRKIRPREDQDDRRLLRGRRWRATPACRSRDSEIITAHFKSKLLTFPGWPPSAHRPHPVDNGPTNLVWGIFLNEMDSCHRNLG